VEWETGHGGPSTNQQVQFTFRLRGGLKHAS